jgi:terminase small subunit / prophage DNA-packing protein
VLLIGADKLAHLFGTTRQTIVAWQASGMPVAQVGGIGRPNTYDAAACIAWQVGRHVRRASDETPKDRLARMQADAVEMDNVQKRSALVPVAAVEPRMRAAIESAQAAWRQVLGRLLPMHTDNPAEVEALLQCEFDAFLVRLSKSQKADQHHHEAQDRT